MTYLTFDPTSIGQVLRHGLDFIVGHLWQHLRLDSFHLSKGSGKFFVGLPLNIILGLLDSLNYIDGVHDHALELLTISSNACYFRFLRSQDFLQALVLRLGHLLHLLFRDSTPGACASIRCLFTCCCGHLGHLVANIGIAIRHVVQLVLLLHRYVHQVAYRLL